MTFSGGDPRRLKEDRGIVITPLVHVDDAHPERVDLALLWATDPEDDAAVDVFFPRRGRTASSAPRPPTYRTFHRNTAYSAGDGSVLSVVGCKAAVQGSLGIGPALRDIFRHFEPKVLILCGIAGALTSDLDIADVVVATNTWYYERGKLTDGGLQYEIDTFRLTASTRNIVDGALGQHRRTKPRYKTLLGPIATGEKVLSSELAEIRELLLRANRKLAAVEMESGAFFAQLHEDGQEGNTVDDWLVVKGISDRADVAKADDDQIRAARNAFITSGRLASVLIRARSASSQL